ncbi:hypothetical protein [Leptolyngbya sp. KIOST-1]|uniref:hypothetical protein n=1 Tax=Leptolyngbya sp. KIOST-1 TaxID=1229172 RepID=UPI0005681B9B|nr:hypothetical protein [Leptolyngbya sp. KIOST-1]
MATSSRPFQSQTVARLVAGYRQATHGAERWLRWGRTAAVWGLQVALYPLYLGIQGIRLGHRRLRAARPWQPLWAKLGGTQTLELVEADTPIRALLSILQPPVAQPPSDTPKGLSLVNRYGQWLRQSRAGAVLTPERWHLIPFQAPIRGIATDLTTRQVVLVTVDNDIFTGLNNDQQQRLQRAMVLMLAEYSRLRRRHTLDHTLQQPWLPLPKSNAATLPPLRWLPSALRWLQTSPLAAATSLFGEVQQTQAVPERTLVPSQVLNARQIYRLGSATTSPLIAEAKRIELRANWGYRPPQFNGKLAIKRLAATLPEAESSALTVAPARAVAQHLSSPLGMAEVQGGRQTALRTAIAPGSITAVAEHSTALDISATVQHQLFPANAIEAHITQVDYIDAPLVAVLRGLDWVLYVIETWLRGVWAWLQKQW